MCLSYSWRPFLKESFGFVFIAVVIIAIYSIQLVDLIFFVVVIIVFVFFFFVIVVVAAAANYVFVLDFFPSFI